MYDIAIIGAGPAGAVLASRLNPQLKTVILEKRDLTLQQEKYSEKPCGGLLNPDAQNYLKQMGWKLPKELLEAPQLFSVRTMDFDNNCELFYQRSYYNLNRALFEKWLISHIPDTTEIFQKAEFKTAAKESGKYRLYFKQNGIMKNIQCRFIAVCDGGGSVTRKALFSRGRPPRLYVSMQEWFEVEKQIPYYTAVFDSEITDFYSWTISKRDHLIVGSALHPGKGTREKFETLKKKMAEKGLPVSGKPVRREGTLLYRPTRLNQIFLGEGRAACIGEAAGLISPSSAEGFSYAFKSAMLLADALNSCGAEEQALKLYKKSCKSLKTNIILKNLKSPGMYYPPLRGAVIKSGIGGTLEKKQNPLPYECQLTLQ